MLKQYKKPLILSSLVLLIPVIVGLLLWNQLPDQLPTHWGINGEIDGWSNKPFAVFGLPGIILALHLLCVLATVTDPKHNRYNPKMMKLVLWICPVIGLILSAIIYATALGIALPVETFIFVLVGVLFIVVGNWLPKCEQTYTMGIKLPWTFASEANWNATHRFGGKVMVAGGVLTMLTAFLGSFWLMMVILAAMVILPTVYSYLYYRNHETEELDGK